MDFYKRSVFSYLTIGLLLMSFVCVLESLSVVDDAVSEKKIHYKRDVQLSGGEEGVNVNQKKEHSSSTTTTTRKPDSLDKKTTFSKDHDADLAAVKEKNLMDKLNCSIPENKNKTICTQGFMSNILRKMSDNSAMLFRTMMVLLGVTSIVIVYFIVRAVRLRRRRSKSRKYGVITRSGDVGDMEMEPLGDGNEDDEDYTVFEMNGRRK